MAGKVDHVALSEMSRRTMHTTVQSDMLHLPVTQLTPSDIVIAVMGTTGAGKSTFIDHIVEHDVLIGHDLISCTTNVGIYSFVHKHTRIHLVDTPGFDDSNRTDTQVLKDVALFLSQTYQQQILLAGIIYLHRITDIRMTGSGVRNLNMFKKLCGEDAYNHVVLATTMWNNLTRPGLSYDVGVKREQELVERKDWWGMMHQRGSKIVHHTDSKESALNIVDYLISLARPVRLNIQKQMVDEAKTLEDTDAGQEYQKELQKLKRLHEQNLQELKESYEQALKDRDMELAETLRQQRSEVDERLNEATRAQEGLKITLEQLQQEKAAQFRELAARIEVEQQKTAKLVSERAADLQRFDEDRKRDRQAQAGVQQRFELERNTWQNQIEEMETSNKSNAAEQQRQHLRQLDELQRQIETQRATDQAQRAKLESKLAEARASETNNAAILHFFAGAATTVVGAVIEQPAFIAGGLSAMAASLR